MNVSLTTELENFVSAKVESGRYNSASEVVREALRLLEEHDHARAAQLAARGSTTPSEQRLPIVVGARRTCHTLFVAEARYCIKCGAELAPAEDREPTP